MYRGRIAPTPTGLLHLGHARTFALAAQRAQQANGVLIYRTEDLDAGRCRAEFAEAAIADLQWLGLRWQEGPDVGGPHGPYDQSQRLTWFREVWLKLRQSGHIYPCEKSRKDVECALTAPHAEDDAEPIFPPALRVAPGTGSEALIPGNTNWRFRVPDGEVIRFVDALQGPQSFQAGRDFGDFLVWRKDGFPAYELAVVADDHDMEITEVVRGADLLLSTARQLLLYRALGWAPPSWAHAPLVLDQAGQRLSKRADGLSIRELRAKGKTPTEVIQGSV
ncbi:MAG: glutamate--tRNA ligase family protein [Verrucomicrobia bacterium]|nr:glutamate--tRNA ligase family protein [Verrucomicrobiota bacterium]